MDRDEALSVLKMLVETNTTNPPGNEQRLAEKIKGLLDGSVAESYIVPCGEDRASLVSKIVGTGKEPPLILCGHMDTVPFGDPERWSFPPDQLTQKGDLLYGRGTSDMKSGLAAMLCAFRTAARREESPRGDIYLALTADEESSGLGAETIAAELPLQGGILYIAEPTDNAIGICSKGALWVRLNVQGQTAHGAYPEKGINAVDAAYEAYTNIRKYVEGFHHALLGHATCTLSGISGGVKENMVADRCTMTLDIRTTPNLSNQDALQQIKRICCEVCGGHTGAVISLDVLNDRSPVSIDPEVSAVQSLRKIVHKCTGVMPMHKGIKFFSDASIFIRHCSKLQCIQFGPGRDDCAHIADEFVETNKYLAAVVCYDELLRAYFD